MSALDGIGPALELVKAAKGEVVVFIGGGSWLYSARPDVVKAVRDILRKYGDEAAAVDSVDDVKLVTEFYEYIASVPAVVRDDVLGELDRSCVVGEGHEALAELIRHRVFPKVLTTAPDHLLERALGELGWVPGADYGVHSITRVEDPTEWEARLDALETFLSLRHKVHIIKIYGSVRPSGARITQQERVTDPRVGSLLAQLTTEKSVWVGIVKSDTCVEELLNPKALGWTLWCNSRSFEELGELGIRARAQLDAREALKRVNEKFTFDYVMSELYKRVVRGVGSFPSWNSLRRLAELKVSEFQMVNEDAWQIASSNRYVPRRLEDDLKRFMRSDKSGMVVAGDSGVGKTTTLLRWIRDLWQDGHVVVPYDAESIACNPQDLWSLVKSQLEIDEGYSTRMILRSLEEQTEKSGKRLVLIFDAIERYSFGEYRHIDLIKSISGGLVQVVQNVGRSRVKVVITGTTHMWWSYGRVGGSGYFMGR